MTDATFGGMISPRVTMQHFINFTLTRQETINWLKGMTLGTMPGNIIFECQEHHRSFTLSRVQDVEPFIDSLPLYCKEGTPFITGDWLTQGSEDTTGARR